MSASELGNIMLLDDLARTDHSFLTPADQCWYLSEYVAGPGFRAGRVNQLIANLKCSPSVAAENRPRRQHKQRAIEELAAALRHAVSRSWVERATWVPIPPSCAASDRNYDDRLVRILRGAFASYDADVRTILYQFESTAADHSSRQRVGIESLFERICINRNTLDARPLRDALILFDDVLTTGKHYKCCERRLRAMLPTIPIRGLFVARRVLSGRGRRMPLDGIGRGLSRRAFERD
jgi:hypothetical protein